MLTAIEEANDAGVRVGHTCDMLQLSRSRYYAWKRRVAQGDPSEALDPLEDHPCGPVRKRSCKPVRPVSIDKLGKKDCIVNGR